MSVNVWLCAVAVTATAVLIRCDLLPVDACRETDVKLLQRRQVQPHRLQDLH